MSRDREDRLRVSGREGRQSARTLVTHARCWQPQTKVRFTDIHRPPPVTVISRPSRGKRSQVSSGRPLTPIYRNRAQAFFPRVRLPLSHPSTTQHDTTPTLLVSPALGVGTIREDAINNPLQTRVTSYLHARTTVAARAATRKCPIHERHVIRRLLLKLSATHRPRLISISDFGILPAYMREAEPGCAGTVGWK